MNPTQNFLFLFLNLDTVLSDSTPENFASIWLVKWNWMRSLKFETVPIHLLSDIFSWRAVELSYRLHSPHNPKPQPGHFNNSTTRRPRSGKPLQTSGSRTFLSFSCFSIANQEAVSRSAALLLRIKALALQKRPLFVLFALVGRTAAILDVAMLCAVEGAQCKTGELP